MPVLSKRDATILCYVLLNRGGEGRSGACSRLFRCGDGRMVVLLALCLDAGKRRDEPEQNIDGTDDVAL
ncbi:hypothetical protein KTH_08180 [Thermosporothrix hazakensis]|uniref:Uncharacterized protein n=1 Tax=Thermosporothrix sp. COM3 TaxID=2490863 RepID=A0A455SF75_9CHLR|nr:hypothetical protein KTC_03730 [Thermosporothrix sp. COM3]GCE45949.1 hypothetical protein KTH_08180 [Thermosporothrix hazakensis]